MSAARTQFATGAVQATGRETDFAMNDDSSFFVVQRDGENVLTRAGDFLFDPGGRLVTPAGHPVIGSNGKPIQINPAQPF